MGMPGASEGKDDGLLEVAAGFCPRCPDASLAVAGVLVYRYKDGGRSVLGCEDRSSVGLEQAAKGGSGLADSGDSELVW
jgi:hypothetical protein